jgi:hypothetical protein
MTMEKDNLNARYIAGSDLFAAEVGKPGTKLNILGIEITPDDNPLVGAANRTGVSGKTMLEQMSHQPDFWAVGGGEGTTGGGTGGSEDNHGPEKDLTGQAGSDYRSGGQEPEPAANTPESDRYSKTRREDTASPERETGMAGNGGMGEG